MNQLFFENGNEYRLKENVYVGEGRKIISGVHVKLDGFNQMTDSAWVIVDGYRFNTRLSNLEQIKTAPSKPAHYDTGIDTIAFLRANCPPEQVEGFLRGNAIKYLQRYDRKSQALSDLKKSRHYIDMLIEELEGRK